MQYFGSEHQPVNLFNTSQKWEQWISAREHQLNIIWTSTEYKNLHSTSKERTCIIHTNEYSHQCTDIKLIQLLQHQVPSIHEIFLDMGIGIQITFVTTSKIPLIWNHVGAFIVAVSQQSTLEVDPSEADIVGLMAEFSTVHLKCKNAINTYWICTDKKMTFNWETLDRRLGLDDLDLSLL